MDDDNTVFSPAYPVELLFRPPARIDPPALQAALARRLGHVDLPGDGTPDKDQSGAQIFFLRDFPVELKDATVCAQLAFLQTDKPVAAGDYRDAVQQSWDLDDAAARLASCSHSIAMVNLMSSTLPQLERRQIVAGGLMAACELMQPELIHWPQTRQLTDPGRAATRLGDPEQADNPVYGFTNVRLFNLQGTDGEMVMDTLGLGALGLTDLQMRFRGLEASDVAGLLHALAAYLLDNGDVIDNGHTVQGLSPDDRWTCMHDMALVAPERVVLDIDPGTPYAAGRD